MLRDAQRARSSGRDWPAIRNGVSGQSRSSRADKGLWDRTRPWDRAAMALSFCGCRRNYLAEEAVLSRARVH